MRLLASGRTNHEIAVELYVTDETVKFHMRNIFRKLGVDNRTQAAYQAARLGNLWMLGAVGRKKKRSAEQHDRRADDLAPGRKPVRDS